MLTSQATMPVTNAANSWLSAQRPVAASRPGCLGASSMSRSRKLSISFAKVGVSRINPSTVPKLS
jgi:hypothetical protein